MKIVHLASEFPPARIFGLGRYVHDLARAQAERGHEVHVLTNSINGRDQIAVINGVHVHRIHFPGPPCPADGATQVTQFNLLLYERIMELMNALAAPDVVASHDWLTILAGDLAKRALGGRLVFTVHDTVIGKTFGKLNNEDKFIALLERWGGQIADAVVAVSRHVESELVRAYEVSPDRVFVVPCAVDPRWFECVDNRFLPELRSALAEPDEPILTYVGRLDQEKGVDNLLSAFARVLPRHPGLKLQIAGKGKLEDELRALASRLDVSDRVRFLEYVSGPALEALFKVSDVVACPSTYEPFGIVPLEAMISGAAVVVSDTGGMAEIVEHEKNGLKVQPGDEQALHDAIDRLLSNSDERKQLAGAGESRAREVFTWGRVAERLEDVYRRPAVRAARRRPKLTAGIRVKNGERFAQECLTDLSEYVDEIVVLDDGSTDSTIDICRSFPKVTQIVRWEKSFFHEGIDRNVVLALAKNTDPDWILLPDIDEVFEDRMKDEIRHMMEDPGVSLYAFLFCHFWRSRSHYRVDGKWGRESSEFPIPRLVRNAPGLHYPVHRPLGTAQIRGVEGPCLISDIRVKHYGHLYEDISREKVRLYSALDPGSDYSYMVDETGLILEEWTESMKEVAR